MQSDVKSDEINIIINKASRNSVEQHEYIPPCYIRYTLVAQLLTSQFGHTPYSQRTRLFRVIDAVISSVFFFRQIIFLLFSFSIQCIVLAFFSRSLPAVVTQIRGHIAGPPPPSSGTSLHFYPCAIIFKISSNPKTHYAVEVHQPLFSFLGLLTY